MYRCAAMIWVLLLLNDRPCTGWSRLVHARGFHVRDHESQSRRLFGGQLLSTSPVNSIRLGIKNHRHGSRPAHHARDSDHFIEFFGRLLCFIAGGPSPSPLVGCAFPVAWLWIYDTGTLFNEPRVYSLADFGLTLI